MNPWPRQAALTGMHTQPSYICTSMMLRYLLPQIVMEVSNLSGHVATQESYFLKVDIFAVALGGDGRTRGKHPRLRERCHRHRLHCRPLLCHQYPLTDMVSAALCRCSRLAPHGFCTSSPALAAHTARECSAKQPTPEDLTSLLK